MTVIIVNMKRNDVIQYYKVVGSSGRKEIYIANDELMNKTRTHKGIYLLYLQSVHTNGFTHSKYGCDMKLDSWQIDCKQLNSSYEKKGEKHMPIFLKWAEILIYAKPLWTHCRIDW